MRCVRRITTAGLLGLALSATPAYAGDLRAAIRVADTVYPAVQQRCGTVTIERGSLSPPNDTNGAIAEAYECTVRIATGVVETYSDARLCSVLTHEWGHLAGRRFPENASDPEHSPDPHDNMYGPYLVHHPACGESDDARSARVAREQRAALAAAEGRKLRLSDIRDELSELKRELRRAKAAMRRARGATRARCARQVRRLRSRIKRLRAEHRSLASPPLL